MTHTIGGSSAAHRIILCADDYGMSAGVSRGILELARTRRLSATSAMVTLPRWPQDAPALAQVRDRIAIGLHINLTVGSPLGPIPSLAPEGRLPDLRPLIVRALAGAIDRNEIAAEVTRQLALFEAATGFPPDHVDGHQHVHALPRIRDGVLDALAKRFPQGGPLVRDPADRVAAIRERGQAVPKAIIISLLSRGFSQAAQARGFQTNDSFSGTSAFDPDTPYAQELASSFRAAGRHHIVMCHPGHPDDELSALDPIVGRRAQEYAALSADTGLESALWRPARTADGPAVSWSAA